MRREHDRQSLRPSFIVAVVVDRDPYRNAGIVDDDIEAAEMRGDLANDAVDALATGNVERPCLGRTAAGSDIGGDRLCAFSCEIGDGDVSALRAEYPRRGAPHAAGRAGDENGQSLDRSAELFEI